MVPEQTTSTEPAAATAPGIAVGRVELRVDRDTPVLVCSDLHVATSVTEASVQVTGELAERVRAWTRPGVLVLNGDCFELLVPAGARVRGALAAHPEWRRALADVVTRGGRLVVVAGSHDAALAWDPDDAAAVEELGGRRCLTLDLVFDTQRGERVVRVEHGHRFDPANAFRDPSNPLDTPFGQHLVQQVLPDMATQPFLRDLMWLADPADLGRFLGSRLVYRQLARHLWWLVLPLVLGLAVRTPVLVRTLSDSRRVQEVGRWLLVAGVGLLADVALLGAVGAVMARRVYRSLAATGLGARGNGRNEAPRAAAEALVAEQFAGFVTGHTHHPELTPRGAGFYANPGCGVEVVEGRPARFGLPPVFAGVVRRSWIELEGTFDVAARLVVAEGPLGPLTLLERLVVRRPRPARADAPTTVAEVPGSSGWPVTAGALAAGPRRVRARRIAAVGTVTVAVIGTLSALTPPLHGRLRWLLRAMPVALPQAASTGTVFASAALVLLARGLRRGQRVAWIATLGLLAATVVLHVVKGGDVEEALIAAALLAWLATHGTAFGVRAGAAAVRRSALLAVGGGGLAVATSFALVGLIGAHRRTDVDESLRALAERLAGRRALPLPGTSPFVGPALTATGIALMVGALWLLFSPRRAAEPDAEARLADREHARRIVAAHGGDTLAYFALRDDKAWFFGGASVVAYAVRNGVCLVSPDPVGPVGERAQVWADFTEFADARGWSVAVVGAQPGWLPVYEAAGLRSLYIGDEAIVDCSSFTLDGGPMKSLRGAYNRVVKAGYRVEFLDPAALEPAVRAELTELMTESRHGEAERGFSMTLSRVFDPLDTGLLLAVARDAQGRAAAFCQYVPAADIDGWSLDLMRRRADPDLPNGVTDVVVIETIRHLAATQRWGLCLNFAVMRAVLAGEREGGLVELQRRVLHKFSETMQIESLWRYNEKFRPYWRPRYVMLSAVEHAAAQGIAIADAEAVWELPLVGRFLGRR